MKNEFPKKFKKQIMAFTERYWELAHPRKMMVSINQTVPVRIVWDSGDKISIDDNDVNYLNAYNSGEVIKYNENIKKFIEETEIFGKIFLGDRDWLWDNVFWMFRPENGEKFNFKKIKWV